MTFLRYVDNPVMSIISCVIKRSDIDVMSSKTRLNGKIVIGSRNGGSFYCVGFDTRELNI